MQSHQHTNPFSKIGAYSWVRRISDRHLLVYFMSITFSSYHFASAKHTIIHQAGLSKFQTNFNTFRRKTLSKWLRWGWWCRLLCVGWTQRFQNGFLYFGWFGLRHISRGYIFHSKHAFWNVIFNCKSGCCSIREISLPALVLTLMFQHGGHYIAFFKGHMVCLSRMEIYVYRANSRFVWNFLDQLAV